MEPLLNPIIVSNEIVHIKKLAPQDFLLFQQLIVLFRNAFEMENTASAKENYLKSLLARPGFIAFVITCGKEIAGGLTAYELPMYYSEKSEIYIYDIAVQPRFMRKSFGTELLSALKLYCRENNISGFFVQAHKEDTHAVEFYKSAGGKAGKVVHFTFEI